MSSADPCVLTVYSHDLLRPYRPPASLLKAFRSPESEPRHDEDFPIYCLAEPKNKFMSALASVWAPHVSLRSQVSWRHGANSKMALDDKDPQMRDGLCPWRSSLALVHATSCLLVSVSSEVRGEQRLEKTDTHLKGCLPSRPSLGTSPDDEFPAQARVRNRSLRGFHKNNTEIVKLSSRTLLIVGHTKIPPPELSWFISQ